MAARAWGWCRMDQVKWEREMRKRGAGHQQEKSPATLPCGQRDSYSGAGQVAARTGIPPTPPCPRQLIKYSAPLEVLLDHLTYPHTTPSPLSRPPYQRGSIFLYRSSQGSPPCQNDLSWGDPRLASFLNGAGGFQYEERPPLYTTCQPRRVPTNMGYLPTC